MVNETVNTGGLKTFVYSSSKNARREVKPREKRFTLNIYLKNLLFKPIQNTSVELRKIDFNFFDTVTSKKGRRSKSKIFKSKTSKKGVVTFKNINEGIYVIRFKKNKKKKKKLIEVNLNTIKNIYAPLGFSLFKRNKKIDNEKIISILNDVRSDLNYCSSCNGKYLGFSDRFKCHRCGKYFCLDHHLPEDHGCKGLKK